MPDTLLAHLRSVAPVVAAIPYLQPADPFLETAGEDMRRRIYLTETANGELRCIRPEFTIPICLDYLKNHSQPRRISYGGAVFQQGRKDNTEFNQAGLEDLGNTDSIAADVACMADMLDALARCGLNNVVVTLGQQQVFQVVVAGLELPPTLAQRLMRNFGAPQQLSAQISAMEDGRGPEIAVEDEDTLIERVEVMMKSAGLSPRAGRSPRDIAARMRQKAQEARFSLSAERADILRRYLAIEAPLDEVSGQLERFAKSSGLAFGPALQNLETSLQQLRARDVEVDQLMFKASFGRKLDYYTGLLFEARVDGFEHAVAGGGRYDRLCTLLGSKVPVPAVGFSISCDRVLEAGGSV